MRIALFTETFLPKVDGIVNTLCYFLKYLENTEHKALVFAPEGGPQVFAGTRVIGLPGYIFPLYPALKLVSPTTDVLRAMTFFSPDLVHVVNLFALGVVGLRHAEQMGLPVVASYHTDIPGFAERWGYPLLVEPFWAYLRWIHNQADLNLCPSQATLAALQQRDFKRLGIWARGIDADLFHPDRQDSQWCLRLTARQPQAPLLLYVGRLAIEKRIECLRPMIEALPEARLAIVGDGPQRAQLEALFAGTPTVFTGFLHGLDLANAYASADVFVFPAANETFGNVVLEAMASGLPVVAANAGGPRDLVRQGETGFLFDPDSMDGLIQAVRMLIENPSYARALGAAGRQVAVSRTWRSVFDCLLGDYAGLCVAARGRQVA